MRKSRKECSTRWHRTSTWSSGCDWFTIGGDRLLKRSCGFETPAYLPTGRQAGRQGQLPDSGQCAADSWSSTKYVCTAQGERRGGLPPLTGVPGGVPLIPQRHPSGGWVGRRTPMFRRQRRHPPRAPCLASTKPRRCRAECKAGQTCLPVGRGVHPDSENQAASRRATWLRRRGTFSAAC